MCQCFQINFSNFVFGYEVSKCSSSSKGLQHLSERPNCVLPSVFFSFNRQKEQMKLKKIIFETVKRYTTIRIVVSFGEKKKTLYYNEVI